MNPSTSSTVRPFSQEGLNRAGAMRQARLVACKEGLDIQGAFWGRDQSLPHQLGDPVAVGFPIGCHRLQPRHRPVSIEDKDGRSALDFFEQLREMVFRFGYTGFSHQAKIA